MMPAIDLDDFLADIAAQIDAVPGLREEMQEAFAVHNAKVIEKMERRILAVENVTSNDIDPCYLGGDTVTSSRLGPTLPTFCPHRRHTSLL